MQISVCLICHDTPERKFMLEQALAGWAKQTERPHQIVVAWDGEVPSDAPRNARCDHVSVPRRDKHANRNGARNAAAVCSTGSHLWFIDGDFVPDPVAIEHAQIALGKEDCALSPVLVGLRATWAQWTANPYYRQFPLLANQWSGFAHRYRLEHPGLLLAEDVTEGFPLVRADVFWELGGFDVSYRGWGANKEEFVDRLRALHDFYPYKLLASTRMYHQPHASEGSNVDPLVLENQRRRTEAAKSSNLINLGHRVRVLCGF